MLHVEGAGARQPILFDRKRHFGTQMKSLPLMWLQRLSQISAFHLLVFVANYQTLIETEPVRSLSLCFLGLFSVEGISRRNSDGGGRRGVRGRPRWEDRRSPASSLPLHSPSGVSLPLTRSEAHTTPVQSNFLKDNRSACAAPLDQLGSPRAGSAADQRQLPPVVPPQTFPL